MIGDNTKSKAFPITRFRNIYAYWFRTIAIVLLIIAIILFIWMWIKAHIIGVIPNMNGREYYGNHGPWRHIYTLRNLWWYTAYTQIFSFYLALVSFLLKRDNKAAIMLFISFIAVLFLMSTYWLVD